MKIGIVTQPLIANYGGFLQAWALQEQLRKMGHEPITIDYLPEATPWYILLRSWVKTLVLLCIGRKRPFMKRQSAERINMFDKFVRKNMSLTQRVRRYKPELVDEYGFEAVITGSDQVWRPRYNRFLQDMFLRFVRKPGVKKIAYAASFGVDYWEYSSRQTKTCAHLAEKLNAISVRENSGIALCKDYLGVDAIEVLDPTLLHTAEDYEKLCAEIPRATEAYLASYVLDLTPEKHVFIENIAREKGLSVRIFSADRDAKLSMEEWLTSYRDASYVITDSFHGTVFSIIFHKPFMAILNNRRGADRFISLLKPLGLESRLISDIFSYHKALEGLIDYEKVELKLSEKREESLFYLIEGLR